jgi:hypothetical protein
MRAWLAPETAEAPGAPGCRTTEGEGPGETGKSALADRMAATQCAHHAPRRSRKGEIDETRTQDRPDGNGRVRCADGGVHGRFPVRRAGRRPVGLRHVLAQSAGSAGCSPPGPRDSAAVRSGPGNARPVEAPGRNAPHRSGFRAQRDGGGQHGDGMDKPSRRPGRPSNAAGRDSGSYRAGPRLRRRSLCRRAGHDRTAGSPQPCPAPYRLINLRN